MGTAVFVQGEKKVGGGIGQEGIGQVWQATMEAISHQGEEWTFTLSVVTKGLLEVPEAESGVIQALNLVAVWGGTE